MLEPVARYTGLPSGYATGQVFGPATGVNPVSGRLLCCFGHHKGAGVAYVQLHDVPPAGSPSNSTIIATLAVPAASNWAFPLLDHGLPFSYNLYALLSTTAATYTASVNADILSFATIAQP